ncbi:MAG: RpiB/LacA/LacB family sugar-phosphate isomerase [Calditrichaeota bacterium]|nr:MAG: RpiB/LacA/LacB family sugar-phosphate isomerase [Calditrichota bacterium]
MKKLIGEEAIRRAATEGRSVRVDAHTVITPAARDLAAQLGVVFEESAATGGCAHEPRIFANHTPRKIAIAADHGGFYLKEELKDYLRGKNFMVTDLGPENAQPCDYPDFAFKVALKVSEGEADAGIMIDSVGIGSAMAANRVPGVLAAKCNNVTEARSAREHNYANYLTLGSKIIGVTAAKEICDAFLNTPGGAERHRKRIAKILNHNK